MGMLEGKTVFITGGSRGIDRKIAERLAADGALVAFNYATSTEAAADTVRGIEADGGWITGQVVDATGGFMI